MKLWIDSEVRSTTPIEYGVDAYAENAELLIVTWAVDDGPIRDYCPFHEPGEPPELRERLDDPDTLCYAHGARFERTVFRKTGFADVPLERWRCTMAQA